MYSGYHFLRTSRHRIKSYVPTAVYWTMEVWGRWSSRHVHHGHIQENLSHFTTESILWVRTENHWYRAWTLTKAKQVQYFMLRITFYSKHEFSSLMVQQCLSVHDDSGRNSLCIPPTNSNLDKISLDCQNKILSIAAVNEVDTNLVECAWSDESLHILDIVKEKKL